jgi:hypothetical protein
MIHLAGTAANRDSSVIARSGCVDLGDGRATLTAWFFSRSQEVAMGRQVKRPARAEAIQTADAAEYLSELVEELRDLAERSGLGELGYMLDVAAAEAVAARTRARLASRRPDVGTA